MWGCGMSSWVLILVYDRMQSAGKECAARDLRSGGGPEELSKHRKQLLPLFNIRHETAVIQRHELGLERRRDGFGVCQWNGLLAAVDDDGGTAHGGEFVREIECAQTFPDRLLHTARDPERSQVAGPVRVGEIAGDAELERALPVCGGIAFLEARGCEFGAEPLNGGAMLPACEFGLERRTVRARDRRRIDQGEPRGRRSSGALRGLDRVQQREEPAPRVAHDR